MSSIRYLLPPMMRKSFSTTCTRLSETPTTPGIISKLKNIFSGASESIMNQQRRALNVDTSSPKIPEDGLNKPQKRETSGLKRKWGVNITDSSIEKELLEEHTPNFVLKQKWGVNLYEPIKPERKDPRQWIPQIPQREIKSSDLTSILERQFMDSMENQKVLEMRNENPPPIIDPGISVVLPLDEVLDPLKPSNEELEIKSPIAFGEVEEEDAETETHLKPEETSLEDSEEDEVAAWQEVMARTKLKSEELAMSARKTRTNPQDRLGDERFSILPEPPAPKLDVAVMQPLDSKLQEFVAPNDIILDVRNVLHRVDSKKFHTLSFFFLCLSMEERDRSDDIQYLPINIFDNAGDAEEFEEGFEEKEEDAESSEPLNAVELEKNSEIQDLQKIVEEKIPRMTDKANEPMIKDVDDYVKIPGDPYPFTREYFDKWQMTDGSSFHRGHKHE
ncbi:uncharacterized protein [Fopius arisanus]|uniref:Uncharacterized protein n=1 Tax=Fopius arisanus TaxID=64838 RepID=A0A9R1TTN8_9HYME|nr:PREDICTED: uncharacterized protein LOC105274207 [Fopius arisanus]XP_011315427.1 PREDICTED: uncharacterized protein LOC105274207 [Fopius arisanus]